MLEQHHLQISCEPAKKDWYSYKIVPIADTSKNSVSTQERNWGGGEGGRPPLPFFENRKSLG